MLTSLPSSPKSKADTSELDANGAMPSADPGRLVDKGSLDAAPQYTKSAFVSSLTVGGKTVDDPDAMEIDGLEQSFTRILNSDIISVTAPSSLFVPKDYSMQLLHSHEVQVKLYEKRLKERQQQRALLSTTTKKQKKSRRPLKLGFDPAEIVRKRALDLGDKISTSPKTSLSCDIHPFFRADNFHGCPDPIYEQLKPALRLASLLLTQKVCSTYWHTLWFGERKMCETTTNNLSKACFRIRKDVPWSAENSRIFAHVLEQQAERIHFYFHSQPLLPTPCFASMAWVTDVRSPFQTRSAQSARPGRHHARTISNGDQDTFQRGKICLHTDFFTVAKRLSKLSHPDPAAALRYNFWLATSLCHEVAHFLEWVRRSMVFSHGHEVFWYDDAWNEAGEAWERKMWGGRVEPVDSRADCKYGIATVDWPLKRWDEAGKEVKEQEKEPRNVYWTIPMEFISMIQQQDTWDKLTDRLPGSSPGTMISNVKSHSSSQDIITDSTFHIPRIGTRSNELLTLDLTMWDDEAQNGLISDDIDDEDTMLKRTFDGRIVKARKKGEIVTKQTTRIQGEPNKVIARLRKKKEADKEGQDSKEKHEDDKAKGDA